MSGDQLVASILFFTLWGFVSMALVAAIDSCWRRSACFLVIALISFLFLLNLVQKKEGNSDAIPANYFLSAPQN